jgi:hypothetical protein
MRRATAIVAVCACAVTGCRGGVTPERYDGAVVRTRSPSTVVVDRSAPAPTAEPIASEVDVPWTIALLSDVEAQPGNDRDNTRDARPAGATEDPSLEGTPTDLDIVVDAAGDRPAGTTKSCPGVVKGRS